MKYLYLFFGLLLITSCGGNDAVTIDPPVAVNDTATTTENTAITVYLLENDDLQDNAELDSYDQSSENNGTIAKKLTGGFLYTPPTNFTGTDTFTYTICDQYANSSCSSATVTITVTDLGSPAAVNDAFEVVENTAINITTLLDNDTLLDGAELESIDATLTNGTVVLNDDGSVTYTASNGFSGEDTFTYTICDTDETPECSTATVTIIVTDEGTPTATNDSYTIMVDASATVLNVLVNDNLLDDATITATDNSGTQGGIVLNSDGTISYTPQAGFEGDDTFTYTICDDDATQQCVTATVTVTVVESLSFNILADLQSYYTGVVFTADADLMFDEISELTNAKHTSILTYTQRHEYLYKADADLNNPDNVILMYTGESRYWQEYTSGSNSYTTQTFNTEHIYPQSLFEGGDGGTEKDEKVKGDLHHLRSCDATVNSNRSNYAFVDGSGTNKLIGNAWYPGDEWKGDVARMVMYINIHYGETISKVGSIDLFLKWNKEDPVSEFEEQRNNVIYAAQGNRNPFIDNPYIATLIWGGEPAENKWE